MMQPQSNKKNTRVTKNNKNVLPSGGPKLKTANSKVARRNGRNPEEDVYLDEVLLQSNRRRSKRSASAFRGVKVRDTPVVDKVQHLTKINNQYLRELVLPEEYGPKAYPDQFESKSTTWRSIINTPLLYNATALGATPAGAFLAVIKPTLRTPVLMQRPSTAALTLRGYAHAQTENYGLFGLADRNPVVSQQQQSMLLNTDWQNIIMPITYNNEPDPVPMFAGEYGTDTFYGHPSDASAYGVTVNLIKVLTAGWTIECRTVTTAGYSAAFTLAQEGTSAIYSSSTVTAPSTPGWPGVGFQLRLAGTAPAGSIYNAIAISVVFACTTIMRWEAVDIPDVNLALDLYDQYRVVAQSSLATYRGSLLDNGGQIAAALFRGGEAPTTNFLYTYDQVAQAPTAHDGPLLDGSYSFWLPADVGDMAFREPEGLDQWLHPYVIISGIVSSPDQVNSLRLRVVTNYEGISKSQLLHYEDSRVQIREIIEAARELKSQPTSMSNNKHLKQLLGFLRRAAAWYGDNKEWIIPAATAVGSSLL